MKKKKYINNEVEKYRQIMEEYSFPHNSVLPLPSFKPPSEERLPDFASLIGNGVKEETVTNNFDLIEQDLELFLQNNI